MSMKVVMERASLDQSVLESELDESYTVMATFKDLDPGQTLEILSSFTARASHVRSLIIRADDRNLTAFRTKQLDPFIEECDRQFKIWSRLISVKQIEWETSRGQR